MAEHSRVTPSGWEQSDATEDKSRVTPAGWTQIEADAEAETPQAVQPYRYLHMLIR